MTTRIAKTSMSAVAATEKTKWHFVQVVLDDGRTGWGEATLEGHCEALWQASERLLRRLIGEPLNDARKLAAEPPPESLPEAALSSAVIQALWDLDAQGSGLCLADHIGERRRDRIGLYANINRKTRDRGLASVAASAREAQAAGYDAIKFAPFDEVQPHLERAEMRAAMNSGLQRAAAIREAIGEGLRLMLDCHWRFDAIGAREMVAASRDLGLYWIECPVPESAETIPLIKELRNLANSAGVRLAGLETQTSAEAFRPYLRAGAYDVMMPDVKYAGGPAEMLRIAELFAHHKVAFSPHNPTGPICHAHSLHVCAAVRNSDLLEHQFDESPAFDAIIGHAISAPRDGFATLDWTKPGLGVALETEPEQSKTVSFSAGGSHS